VVDIPSVHPQQAKVDGGDVDEAKTERAGRDLPDVLTDLATTEGFSLQRAPIWFVP
jgi:hypothetical protein